MAQSTLIVYDSIESLDTDERLYWGKYIQFYEQYWGGPMSPFGIWFGNEYENFSAAIAEYFSVEKGAVRDCFFIRSKDGLFVCPLSAGENPNVLSCENAVPIEWCAVFDESGRRNFYSHWGFSSIHYNARVVDIKEKLVFCSDVLARARTKTAHKGLLAAIDWMSGGIGEMDGWFSGKDGDACAVLNYGDVCSVLTPQSLDRERTVEQFAETLSLLDDGQWESAYTLWERIVRRWEDLRQICSAGDKPLQ